MLLSIRKKANGSKAENLSTVGRAESLLPSLFCVPYPWEIFARGDLINCKQGSSNTLWEVGIQAYLLLAVRLLIIPILSMQVSWGRTGRVHLARVLALGRRVSMQMSPSSSPKGQELTKCYEIWSCNDTDFSVISLISVCDCNFCMQNFPWIPKLFPDFYTLNSHYCQICVFL